MLLTPPDVISQTLIAIPMLLLFELGLLFAPLFLKRKQHIKNEKKEFNEDNSDDLNDEFDEFDEIDKQFAKLDKEDQ